MENKKITKEDIDKIPSNLFYNTKSRKQIKQFYKELRLLINEKVKKKEKFTDLKNSIFLLIKKIFPDKYQYFYVGKDFQSLEIFIFCLCNQIEAQISRIVEGYRSFDFSQNDPDLNIIKDDKNKNNDKIPSFLISFYDFFEDELVINNEDIMKTVIDANKIIDKNNNNTEAKKNAQKEEINNSYLLSIFKIINSLNDVSIANEEFKNIFTEGIKTPTSNYFCLNDLGFLMIKIIESIIKISELSMQKDKNGTNANLNQNVIKFIQISYVNVLPCIRDFFAKIILNYNLNSTFNIILKKEEFITLLTKLSSIKSIRLKLLQILSKTGQVFKKEQETYCKKIIIKHKVFEKIIRHINNDLMSNIKKYYNASEILSEIKLIIIYFTQNNLLTQKSEESLNLLFSNILKKFLKTDKNCTANFKSFFEDLNSYSKTLSEEDKYKIYNTMISIFQISSTLSKLVIKILLDNFKNNPELYQDMIGKTNFFNLFVRNIYKYDGEMINFFFGFLIDLYNKHNYLPYMELTNVLNSITFFSNINTMKILIQNLTKFNEQVNQKKRIISVSNKNQNKKKSNKEDTQEQIGTESTDFYDEINQNYIDIVMNIINDIISQAKNASNKANLFKPELLSQLLDYIQEIIKIPSINQYYSSKNFQSLFHSLVLIPNYKPIAYKLIEVFLRSSLDKEHNEAFIKLILNRFISLSSSSNKKKETDEKKIFFIEINKLREYLLMCKTLKVTFLQETLSASQKNLNEKIVDFVLKYVDYLNNIKKKIYNLYNGQFHLFFKEYLEYLFGLLVISNENIINKRNELSPKLNYENFDKVIYKTILFFKEINILKIKMDEISTNESIKDMKCNEIDDRKCSSQSVNTYIGKFPHNNEKTELVNKSISTDINNSQIIDNNDGNNFNSFDYLFDIIKYFIDKSLNIPYNRNQKENIKIGKFDGYYIVKYKISKSILNTAKNKNIISNFIIQNPTIIVLLLKNLFKNNIYLDLFFDFIYLSCLTNENNIIYLLRQNLLKIVLNIASKTPKYNYTILKILNHCFKFLTKEELKQVFEFLIKMFNTNNHSITKDILKILNSSFRKITSSDYDYSKGIILSNYVIKQPNTYNLININNINLTCSTDSSITIKEEVYLYSSSNSKLILLKLENEFFAGNRNKQFLEISLFNHNLSISENEANGPNNSEPNISLNAEDFINLNDVNIFNYTFIRSESKLMVSVNGKNMFSHEYKFEFPNSEKKKDIFSINATAGYPLETIQEVADGKFFIFPHVKILSLNITLENASKEKTNIYKMKMNKIKLLDKSYDQLTNFKLDEDTMLISKYNSYFSMKINSIYYQKNLKAVLYNNIFFINGYLSDTFNYTFRLEKYLFILLNSLNLDKDLFKLLMHLLCSYFMINRAYLPKFLAKEEINASLYFIMYKNAPFLDKSTIEIILPAFLSYDNLNSSIVTDILLDYEIFQKLNNETRKELLNLIDRKLLIDDYNLDILLLEKLSNLLIFCLNDIIKSSSTNVTENANANAKTIDEIIIEIICKLIFKNSQNSLFFTKVKEIFYVLFNFHTFVKEHITSFNKGRPKETYQIISNFFKKMFINDYITKIKASFIKLINSKINLDKSIKSKLIDLCNTYNPKNNNYSIFKEGENNAEINKNEKNNIFSEEIDDAKNSKDIDFRSSIMKKFLDGKDNFIMKGKIGGKNDSSEYCGKPNVITVKINLENKEEITCNGDCQLCKYIKKVTKDLFIREIKFNIFESYMLNNYAETYMFNNNLNYNLSFSYYLMKTEGISRIRKIFELRVDKIANIEIDRSPEEVKKKAKENDLQKLFKFYKKKQVSECLCDMFNLAQIFDIDLITECIDENDEFQNCFNCLLFEGLNYINSVLIIGKEKLYLLTNVNISSDYILYNAINSLPRTFWVLENYNNTLYDQCKYLQMLDELNKINKKSSKSDDLNEKNNKNSEIFKKEEKGFQIYSFYYWEINELHKRRFLHQNNAIEIFLKNGINYYLAFNVDLRDIIVGKIIQNLIDAQNLRSKYLIINNLNEYNLSGNNTNGNTTDVTSTNSNSNNEGSFQINNNSSSTIKNENMIFIRNKNLFIEKDKNKLLNILKHKTKLLKGKKNSCTITDSKEILEEAMEKWSEGFLSTFSYLMILNTLSGRTYNNLAQYPIFPWILKDYSSKEIDLNESSTYRDLSYPIYAQDDEIRENLKIKYESFEDNEVKYHCGSHYSNSGFVCYYLIRVKPFSNIAAEIQGNCFDTPDRLFFNIQKFYVVQEKYQELIPDIFNLPELYININNYIYGKTTDNTQVLDVVLPPWALHSPRLFSKMNKKALESQFVSQHINDWIDLIFGYKRSGTEAEKSYNVLKDIFANFDPKKEEEDMVEAKINELCEMGIDPIQLFKKEHPKREKHQVNKAFFGKNVYLQKFEPRESDNYQIKNFHSSSKIKEIYSYYERKNGILSHGEGGLSSFRMNYENDTTFLKGKSNDSNIYFIIGEKKTLMPPSYKNFVEWGIKNTLSIVKPFHNIKYTFKIKHMKNYIINCIKISSDGKFIVLGYDNGVIEKYKLKKVDNCYIEETINDKNNLNDTKSSDGKKVFKSRSKGKNIFTRLFSSKKGQKNSNDPQYSSRTLSFRQKFSAKNNLFQISLLNNNDEKENQTVIKNHIIFNPKIPMSSSNILNSECVLLNSKNDNFIQYNSVSSEIHPANSKEKDIEGYYYHSKNTSELKHLTKHHSSSEDSNKGYIIFLVNSSYSILSEVCLIDICDSYSFMIVADKMNHVYLYNFHSFKLLKYIDISSMFTNQIKYSSICPYTGDFIVSSSKNLVLMNINGVFLSQMNDVESKINSCFITIIHMTESDLFLFTGHKNGFLIVSKLVNDLNLNLMGTNKFVPNNSEDKKTQINSVYQEAFKASENNYRKYLDSNNMTLYFDTVIKVACSENPIRFIKLTEDLTEVICIDNKNKLIYITYEKFFANRKENKNQTNLKTCPMCKSAISSSKILCHLCGKKLCSNCKIEKILPEYSFKNPKPICEECLQIVDSTNKMLYDF